MKKRKIKLLNNKYIIVCHIKINKGTKVFYESKIICTIWNKMKLAAQIRIACPYVRVSCGKP
jgi:hypothetical protein